MICSGFANPIKEHPLLIYLTALPFTPVNTTLFQEFVKEDIPRLVNGYQRMWSPLLQVLSGHTGSVNSVACSANGQLIVSGSHNHTVRV